MTQADIFKATGIHMPKLSLIENGYVVPSDDEKQKISNALSCKPSEITY